MMNDDKEKDGKPDAPGGDVESASSTPSTPKEPDARDRAKELGQLLGQAVVKCIQSIYGGFHYEYNRPKPEFAVVEAEIAKQLGPVVTAVFEQDKDRKKVGREITPRAKVEEAAIRIAEGVKWAMIEAHGNRDAISIPEFTGVVAMFVAQVSPSIIEEFIIEQHLPDPHSRHGNGRHGHKSRAQKGIA